MESDRSLADRTALHNRHEVQDVAALFSVARSDARTRLTGPNVLERLDSKTVGAPWGTVRWQRALPTKRMLVHPAQMTS
jgi:hypothetical protein